MLVRVVDKRVATSSREICAHMASLADAGPVGVPPEQYKVHTFSVVTCWAACQRLGMCPLPAHVTHSA